MQNLSAVSGDWSSDLFLNKINKCLPGTEIREVTALQNTKNDDIHDLLSKV